MNQLRKSLEWEAVTLHNVIKNLARTFGRNNYFSIDNIYTNGGAARLKELVVFLPENVIQEHLNKFERNGWVTLNIDANGLRFRIKESFPDLPDQETFNDLLNERMNYLEFTIKDRFPDEYDLIETAQQKLIVANSSKDYSEIGNLCLQFWEDFSEALWYKYAPKGKEKPPKDKLMNKVGILADEYIKSKTDKAIHDSLSSLFEAMVPLLQKNKHRGLVTLRHAKLSVILTILVAEEILTYLP